jgi:Flavodoxin
MRAVVAYESMFGNTHQIADAIADGMRPWLDVDVVAVDDATPLLDGADVLVVGGPTHVHGMTRARTRAAAAQMAEQQHLPVDPSASGGGVRTWLAGVQGGGMRAAAFDTRAHGLAMFTGRASKGIARGLRHHGFTVMAGPKSFIVTGDQRLEADELSRARAWGQLLAAQVAQPVAS